MDKVWLVAWSHKYVHQQYERGCMLYKGYHVNYGNDIHVQTIILI